MKTANKTLISHNCKPKIAQHQQKQQQRWNNDDSNSDEYDVPHDATSYHYDMFESITNGQHSSAASEEVFADKR